MSRPYRHYWESYQAPGLQTCPDCGAAVGDTEQHDKWHNALRQSFDDEIGSYHWDDLGVIE